MNKKLWAYLVTLSILWGATFFAAKIMLGQYDAMGVVFWRVSLAALALFFVCLLLKKPIPRSLEMWKAFLGMSVLNNMIPMFLLFWSMHELSSGLAAILNASTPLFTVLVLHFGSKDEKATWNKSLGVFIGFCGVVVLMGFNNSFNSLMAVFACLGATFSYALSSLWGKRFKSMNVEAIHIAFGQLTCSTLVLGVICVIGGYTTFQMPQSSTIAYATISISLLSTALAYILFFTILNQAGASNVMLVTFLVPISALWMGAFFLNETIILRHIFGMFIVGLGLICIDGRLFMVLRKTRK